MWRQIRLLSNVQLRAAFGWNEAKYGKDPRKKRRILLLHLAFAYLAAVVVFYVVSMSRAFVRLHLTQVIPAYLFSVTSLLILSFSIFRASGVIFSQKDYEHVIVLPVRSAAIVVSRFLTMYLLNLAMSVLVMLPGALIYGRAVGVAASFPFILLLGTLLLPLLPMTVATALSAGILALSSRMRHKNLASTVLSMLLAFGVLAVSFASSARGNHSGEDQLAVLSAAVIAQLGRVYPPAILFSRGLASGDWDAFLIFVVGSAAAFALLVRLVQRRFAAICAALHTSTAKRNFVMQRQTRSTPLRALYRKELRRYFSSGTYVLNTGFGYLLMVIASAAALVTGPEKIAGVMQLGGMLPQILPVLLAFLCVMSPTTASAVSMEGGQWWIVQSLPVTAKAVFDSKILVGLTVALPCYAVSELLLCMAFRPGWTELALLLLLPLAYLGLSMVAGLLVNVKMPVFQWESETVVVKQSGAVFVSMLIGFISVGIPAVALFALPGAWRVRVLLICLAAAAAAALFLYRRLIRIPLNGIQ